MKSPDRDAADELEERLKAAALILSVHGEDELVKRGGKYPGDYLMEAASELATLRRRVDEQTQALTALQTKLWDWAEGCYEDARQANVEGEKKDERLLMTRHHRLMVMWNIATAALPPPTRKE